jgi:MFS family permease
MTGLMAMTTTAKQVYIIRVFLGAFESSAWPGMMTLFMLWYTPLELAKRMGYYHSCQALGSMLSGAMQAGIMGTMDGRHGLAGWRWYVVTITTSPRRTMLIFCRLFIINAVITVIWGCLGVVMLPDYPNKRNPRAFWFSRNDQELAIARLIRHKRAEAKPITRESMKRTFS